MSQRVAETACCQRGARGSSKWLDVSEMAARETKLPCLQVSKGDITIHFAGELQFLAVS